MPNVSVGDHELSYSFNGVDDREDGLTIVLVHGSGGQLADWPVAWRSNADMTRLVGLTPKSHDGGLDKFPVYAIDLPGHGKSGGNIHDTVDGYAKEIAAFLDALNLQDVFLVGHSMGAAIALTLAVEHNPRLASIGLIGASSKLMVSPAILEGLQNNFEATVENIVRYSWHKKTTDFFKQKGRQRLLEAGSEVVYSDYLACSRYDLSDRIGDVELPVLIIVSKDDKMVPADASAQLAEGLKRCTRIVVEDCGHYQQLEETARVANELTDYLNGELAGR
ncbi:MAG: alpha/beta fold hydrolase [Hyphomicrobiales bacterium]|nr:alpha/beta fold hydrolase [Hyphomicrobiales bacterium]MCP4999441.1 alpha/beta fold hydrolase [Hyphomicrobiales bacterium]